MGLSLSLDTTLDLDLDLDQRLALEEGYSCVLRRTERLCLSGKYVHGLKALCRQAEAAIAPHRLALRSRGDSLLYLAGASDTRQSMRDYYHGTGKRLVETHSTPQIDLIDIALILEILVALKAYGYQVSKAAIKANLKKEVKK